MAVPPLSSQQANAHAHAHDHDRKMHGGNGLQSAEIFANAQRSAASMSAWLEGRPSELQYSKPRGASEMAGEEWALLQQRAKSSGQGGGQGFVHPQS